MDLFGSDFTMAHAITIIGTYMVTAISLFKLLSLRRIGNGQSGFTGNKCTDIIEVNARTLNHNTILKEYNENCDKHRRETFKTIDTIREQHREDIKNIYVELRDMHEMIIDKLSKMSL